MRVLADVMAFRVLVDELGDCYHALGIIHSAYHVVPGRFKYYISTPKPNNYRSLHTGVIGPERSGSEWWVARVEAWLPPATPRFEEVRGEVASRRLEEEGETGTQGLCDRLRRRARIVVNEGAIPRLTAATAGQR